jgi:hypothetical protein
MTDGVPNILEEMNVVQLRKNVNRVAGICNGLCFEKDLEVDFNYRRFLVLCGCSTITKVWLCEFG